MKTRGNVEATANLIYGKQIYQNAQKNNAVVIDGTPSVFDTVQFDCNNGNVQSINLDAATANVIVKISNLKLGNYVIVFKQHSSICKSVSFQPALNSNFDMLKVGASQYATVVLTWDGSTLRSNSTTSTITNYSSSMSYGIGALVIHENALYQSTQQVPLEAFDSNKWQALSSASADTISYTDTYSTGNTDLQSIVDYLITRPSVDFKRYASIDAMLAEISLQNESTLCLVDNVEIGTARDARAKTGFAYYTRIGLSANITSYNIVGQFSAPATRTSFDNTIASIPNNPTNVKTAIDELSRLIEVLSTGQRYISIWDADANERFLANNAYYDDLTKNPVIDLYNAGSKQATVLTANWPSTVAIGHPIRIVNATTGAFVFETTIANLSISGANTIVTLTDDTGVLQGHRILTANKRATSGEYFITSNPGTKSLDGTSSWLINDRVMSNGLTWDKIVYNANPSVDEAPVDNKLYGRKNAAWEEVPDTTVDAILNASSTNAISNQAVTTALETKIEEAPADGKQYSRTNENWVEVLEKPAASSYSYAISNVSASGVLSLHGVSADGTVLISKSLDFAYTGVNALSKDAGWTNDIVLIHDKLFIAHVDKTTSELKFLVLHDFDINLSVLDFGFSSATIFNTSMIIPQYTVFSLIHHIDNFYVVHANAPTTIKKYSAHEIIELATFTFPNDADWNNASMAQIFGNDIVFVAGANAYTGYVRLSRISLDFNAYSKILDVTANSSRNTLPGSGMLINDGFAYVIQSTYDDTKFNILKYDLRDINSPLLISNVQHNFTAGNAKGLAYGITIYGDMLYVPINWIGSLPSNADRQLWSIKLSDLSVYQKLTLADNSALLTISEQGRIIWATVNEAFAGDSDAKLYSINPVDFSEVPTVLLDIPGTERFSGISKRKTSKDILRQNGYIPYKTPTTIGVPGTSGDILYHNGTTWVKSTEVSNFQNGSGSNTIILPDTPIASTLKVFRNGLKQRVNVHYTLTDSTITFLTNTPVTISESVESIYLKF